MYPNLKLQIFKSGIHQNHLARQLGLTDTVLSKIIHGYREPTEIQRKLLAGFLRVDENWLFERYDGVGLTIRVGNSASTGGDSD
jgi:transcriptional regulator with XRE-family HTH domain